MASSLMHVTGNCGTVLCLGVWVFDYSCGGGGDQLLPVLCCIVYCGSSNVVLTTVKWVFQYLVYYPHLCLQ